MSDKYRIWDNSKAYFITMTVIGWVNVFTNNNYRFILIDSLRYCQKEKGLKLFGYCIMSNHLHLIASASEEYTLSDILRDFKKFTSKSIIKEMLKEKEGKNDWILDIFRKAGKANKKIKNYKFWQDGNHAEIIMSNKFFDEKIDYIHNNPVKKLIVKRPEDYLFSSARNYAGLSNYLEIIFESVKQRRYR